MRSVLQAAAGNTAPLDELILQGSVSPQGSQALERALRAAAAGGFAVPLAQLLSQDNVAVDARSDDGWTALMGAAQGGHLSSVEMLLQNQAAVDVRNERGFTPLMLSVMGGHANVVKVLLTAGAAVNARNDMDGGHTVLMYAAQYSGRGRPDESARSLLDAKAAVAEKTEYGWTALLFAAQSGAKEVVEMLLDVNDKDDTGDRVNEEKNVRGETALMWAARKGHATVVDTLLRRGATVLTPADNTGKNAPAHAAECEDKIRALGIARQLNDPELARRCARVQGW